ncbi:MAG: LytTR family DNA-binding domain-containing protein [Lachnospiraceae bacterium]|nr:LytTR family DNA-binding domain-containing protein [Lachnospiraceae bacterium]
MKPLKIALCDDNPVERAYFFEMCKKVKEQGNIPIKLKEYESGDALLIDFQDTRVSVTVDIVLLDISMPGKSGVEVAKKLREDGFQGIIIFVTKSEKHWKTAFDVSAFNYVNKDADAEKRFTKVLKKATQEAKKRRDKSLLFSSLNETRKIDVASISHFEVSNYMMCVYYGQSKFEFTSSMLKIKELLFDNDDFMQVNRSSLLSVSHIEKFESKTKTVVMQNGAVIPVTRQYIKKLKEAMEKAWIEERS